jgi:hypothetical protein
MDTIMKNKKNTNQPPAPPTPPPLRYIREGHSIGTVGDAQYIKSKQSSFLCWLRGHKWQEWETTEIKKVPETILIGAGFGQMKEVYTGHMIDQEYGYFKELKACRRCGRPNPNYEIEKK